jgi:hypothetical protein
MRALDKLTNHQKSDQLQGAIRAEDGSWAGRAGFWLTSEADIVIMVNIAVRLFLPEINP